MSLEYIEQSVKKLNYLFITACVDIKDSFKIISQKEYDISIGKLVISIIGESHAIQFKNNNINFIEILAYVKNKNLHRISTKSLLIKDLKNKLSYKYKNPSYDYIFLIKREKISYPAANKLLLSLKKQNSDGNSLMFEWFEEKKDLPLASISSFTFIKYKLLSSRRFKVNTFHFYKNELSLVATSSEIKIKAGNIGNK